VPPRPEGASALRTLRTWPRRSLAHLPTPLVRAERLETELGVRRLYLKMDAETGFALGGNKVRKLEMELAPSRLEGITDLVTAGAPQSNHCRVTAAAAARFGLGCVLVVNGSTPERPTGNARLHELFGAKIVPVAERSDREAKMEEVADRIRDEGGRARVVPIGASTGLGSLGYALAADELMVQLDATSDGCEETRLFVSSSSGGTLAGLVLGLALLRREDVHVYAVSADSPAEELRRTALELASDGARLLAADVDTRTVRATVLDDQVGEGYGLPTTASGRATRLFGALAGVVLDPTYTAKAAAGLVAHTETDPPGPTTRLVFLHTGGAPGFLS